jgi:hypothetical protein
MTNPLGPGRFMAYGDPVSIMRVLAMLVETDPNGYYEVFRGMPVNATT